MAPRPVLVAPDAFKGTFSAAQVAAAIGRGLEAEGVGVDLCPVADGGEGTLAVLLTALGGETRGTRAHDPLGRMRPAGFALLEGGGTALLEVAEASGLHLAAPAPADAATPDGPTPASGRGAMSPQGPMAETAWAASTRGTGELIVAAVAVGAAVVVVAAGGSATTDGGAGALEAIAEAGGLCGARLVVLCDVTVPWEACARTFAPQKGADAATVARLEARLEALAARLPRDPRGVPGTGAAGGLAGGLWAAHDAVLEPGAAWVLDALGVDARLAAARAVIIGEGRLDAQSAQGKVPGELARRAAAAGVPCHAVVGSTTKPEQDARLLALGHAPSSLTLASLTVATDLGALEAAGRALARGTTAGGSPP